MIISLQNKLFHGIHRSPTKNMDKDNQDITIQWLLSPVLGKSCYQAAHQILRIA